MISADITKRIEETINNIDDLPTLPTIYSQLNENINDPKASARRISAIIEEDQALTAKIFKVINSAFYSFPQKISSISHAVVLLGFNEIKHIALAVSVIDLFGDSVSGRRFNHMAFWSHSLAVAVCSRIIAKKAGPMLFKDPEEVFAAGLMHDIGKIVEDQFMHNDFVKVLVAAGKDGSLIKDAENKILQFDHQDTGKFLARKWKLPESFLQVISLHNSPEKCSKENKNFPLVSAVHVADVIVRSLKIGYGGDEYVPPLHRDSWDVLGFSKGYIEVLMQETEKAFDEVSIVLTRDGK